MHTLEPLPIQQLPPVPPVLNNLGDPKTELEKHLLQRCQGYEKHESAIVEGYHGAYAQVVLAEQQCRLLRGQLVAKEDRVEACRSEKGKGKLLGDGLPQLLTDGKFYKHAVEHNEQITAEVKAQERKKEEAAEKKQARDACDHEQWKVGPLAVWEVEHDQAKLEGRWTQWCKPTAPPRLPAVPKPWLAPTITIGEPGPSKHIDAHSSDKDDDEDEDENGDESNGSSDSVSNYSST
ncbi:hypothetical protein RSAG8_07869, partial [Rhizoctonia solani AG-8 WAC10335]